MNRRTIAGHSVVAIVFALLTLGCDGSGGAEPASGSIADARPFDCPVERIAKVTDLHSPGAACATARERVGANLESHHYRVACQAVQGAKPLGVEAVQANACREDDRGAWTDVEICCPALATASPSGPATAVADVASPRRLRLEVVAPAVGTYGTASVSLEPPPRSTEYRVRIAPESCDVFQLHPNPSCQIGGSYTPGQTSTFMVRYTPGSTHRRGGVLTIDFLDPALSDVEVRLSGGVGTGSSDWLSVPLEPL